MLMNADFLAAVRLRQRPVVKMVCFFGIAILVVYLISASLLGGDYDLRRMVLGASVMSAAILVYYGTSMTNAYLTIRWIEAPPMIGIYLTQIYMNSSFFPVAGQIGSSPTGIVTYNTATLLSIFSVTSIGSPFAFAIMSITVTALCGAIISRLGLDFAGNITQMMPVFTVLAIANYANREIHQGRLSTHMSHLALAQQARKVEELLFNVLPEKVANRLKAGETVADAFSEVSVIFIDIVGFSSMARRLAPRHLLEVLNAVFMAADDSATVTKVEKVKTIGDAYLAVAGASHPLENCAISALDFARDVIAKLPTIRDRLGFEVSVRIGIHTGAVVGGVIGTQRQAYDYWGETMNVASRIQTVADPNTILVSETTYYRAGRLVDFLPPRMILLKGIGETIVYQFAEA